MIVALLFCLVVLTIGYVDLALRVRKLESDRDCTMDALRAVIGFTRTPITLIANELERRS